jgi:hypothetical protein
VATYIVEGDFPEVVSLSAGQVSRLLHTLDHHRDMLRVGHEDARRLTHQQIRPGYLLDFELIFRYMFRAEPRPDLVQELQYLFDRPSTSFLIGPGTQFEIAQFLHSAGYVIQPNGTVDDLFPHGVRDRGLYGLDEDTVKVGVYRLSRLLEMHNLHNFSDLMANPKVDEATFATAKAALDTRRRSSSSANSNRSDALNLAAVVYLRRNAPQLDIDFHPYLLTDTRPVLDEANWGADILAPVSRRPSDAIYTEVLLDIFPDPAQAASHTVEMSYKAAALDHELRRTPAYLFPNDFVTEPEWEHAVANELISDQLRKQLRELAKFVTDRVITETQQIYDNAQLATASIVQQRGEVLRSHGESPRKLFDLIVEVSAALKADRGGAGLADLWRTVLKLRTQVRSDRVTYSLLDNGNQESTREYLIVEHYPAGVPSAEHELETEQFVLRWPSSLDAESVIDSFCRAFDRHGVKTVDLTIGTDDTVEHFGATVPISLTDVLNEIQRGKAKGATASSRGKTKGTTAPSFRQLRWVRMGSAEFDLYADVSPPDLTHEPVIGVFVSQMNREHLQELYTRTSARYLLPAWLRGALEDIEMASTTTRTDQVA